MSKVKAERPVFSFNRGLNSDAPVMTFPKDFSVDELNFELMLDGSRRKRRGLEQEAGGDTLSEESSAAVRTFKWRAVGGNPDINFHVWQIGTTLYFADDVANPSSSMRGFTIDLVPLAIPGYEDDISWRYVDMAFGRGHAILVGQYISPVYITYDEATDTLETSDINLRERDYQGVEDGVDNITQPATLTEAYQYNLVNQGWVYGDVTQYFAAHSKYPAKNMIPWMGYRRQVIPGYAELDGVKEFSPDKLIAELFQDAPAPRGHFILNPFDTNVNLVVETEVVKNYFRVTSHGVDDLNFPAHTGPGTFASTLVTVEFDSPHFLQAGDKIPIYSEARGKRGTYSGDGGGWWTWGSWEGTDAGQWGIEEVVDERTVKMYIVLQDDSAGWRKGHPAPFFPTTYSFVGGDTVSLEGTIIDERPTCTAFFAGRAVYSGIPHPSLSSAIYISQVVEADTQYGKCYQVADPTDENISDIVPSDGLVLRIPEMGRALRMMPYGASLLIYATGGVWELGPGADGYFSATSYSIRKISDVRCVSARAVVDAEGVPVFWADSGIFAIIQDTNTGFLTVTSITQTVLDVYYSQITLSDKGSATADFDGVNKRIIWTYFDLGDFVYKALIYDLRYKAFSPWAFQSGCNVLDIFTVTESQDDQNTLRFIVNRDDTYRVTTATSLEFEDVNGTGSPYEAYLLGGYDTADSPTRRKHAPVVHVFCKQTEIVGSEDIENSSSILLTPRWDWADSDIGFRYGTAQQVYRHSRPFTIDDVGSTGDPISSGTPVIVTRNKIRGRGRCLSLHYYVEPGPYDAHILGWSINFDVLTDN